MTHLTRVQLSRKRCGICGYRKIREPEVRLLPYLCYWCSPNEIKELGPRELIEDMTVEAEGHLKQKRLTSCESIDVLSFIADIGELGSRHPYLKQFSSMLGLIAAQVALERRYTPERLLKVASGGNPMIKRARVRQCIEFLTDVGLLERGKGKYIYERFRPSDLLLDLATSVEAVSRVESELPPRLANCVAGYALLKGIGIAIDWLRGGAQGEPSGIIKLYPMGTNGKLWIPKSFTAPTMFLLGHLAHGHGELSENYLRAWLSSREISGKDANWIVNWLARTVPSSSHRLVDPLYNGRVYHFKFNPSYVRMRDRYRDRRRRRVVA